MRASRQAEAPSGLLNTVGGSLYMDSYAYKFRTAPYAAEAQGLMAVAGLDFLLALTEGQFTVRGGYSGHTSPSFNTLH